ncbi:MAG: helix-turn-helix protein [Caulobacteraceae bacterium]|nr:helix-turn-helix protein [Caulobacteraceae bacterium]
MTAALQNYQTRMQRVLDHIDQHLDTSLDLDTISAIAAFSRFHFQRQFAATFDMSAHRYVQLARLKRAAQRLTGPNPLSVTQAALEAGYDAPDAFARTFRQRVGQSPSQFRKSPDWAAWIAAFAPLDLARTKLMQINFEPHDVVIRDLPPTPVAIVEHRGDRANFPQTRQKFIDARKAAGLSPQTTPMFMVFRSEREPANPEDYAADLCFVTDGSISDPDLKAGLIPGGRCAVLRYPGDTQNLEPAALYLYRDWLPASGEEARDFPLYSQRRLEPIPGVGAYQMVLELFLPLK